MRWNTQPQLNNPTRVWDWVMILGFAYRVAEFPDFYMAVPTSSASNVKFMILKSLFPRWREALPIRRLENRPQDVILPKGVVAFRYEDGLTLSPQPEKAEGEKAVVIQVRFDNQRDQLCFDAWPEYNSLAWDIFPPEEVGPRMFRTATRRRRANVQRDDEDWNRIEQLKKLRPVQIAVGYTEGLSRAYLVAIFPNNRVIAESPNIGNALYEYHGADWQRVLSLPKAQARRRGARRVVHSGNWEARAKALLEA